MEKIIINNKMLKRYIYEIVSPKEFYIYIIVKCYEKNIVLKDQQKKKSKFKTIENSNLNSRK